VLDHVLPELPGRTDDADPHDSLDSVNFVRLSPASLRAKRKASNQAMETVGIEPTSAGA
jgi:hypothetical protein